MSTPHFQDGIRLVATRTAMSCAGLFVVSTLMKWALRCFKWVTQREHMYAGVGLVRLGSWSLAAGR